MAKEDNLIPFNEMSKEQQREIASMGGKATAEKMQRRKTLKETLLLLLAEGKTQDNITLSLLEKAANGDTKAYEVIRDTIGEKQKEQVELGNIDDKPFEIKVDIVK